MASEFGRMLVYNACNTNIADQSFECVCPKKKSQHRQPQRWLKTVRDFINKLFSVQIILLLHKRSVALHLFSMHSCLTPHRIIHQTPPHRTSDHRCNIRQKPPYTMCCHHDVTHQTSFYQAPPPIHCVICIANHRTPMYPTPDTSSCTNVSYTWHPVSGSRHHIVRTPDNLVCQTPLRIVQHPCVKKQTPWLFYTRHILLTQMARSLVMSPDSTTSMHAASNWVQNSFNLRMHLYHSPESHWPHLYDSPGHYQTPNTRHHCIICQTLRIIHQTRRPSYTRFHRIHQTPLCCTGNYCTIHQTPPYIIIHQTCRCHQAAPYDEDLVTKRRLKRWDSC